MYPIFRKRRFQRVPNPVPDMAYVSPATLMATGLAQNTPYDFSYEHLPDKFDFVGAQHYSKRMANLVAGMVQERNKQLAEKQIQLQQQQPEPQPQPEPQQ